MNEKTVKYEMFSSSTADPTENQQQDICSAFHNLWENAKVFNWLMNKV